jgi:hypothetical protein
MTRFTFLVVINLLTSFIVLGQWIPVPQVRSELYLYVNASSNGQYEYVKYDSNNGALMSGIINSDGSLGVRYSYPAYKSESFSALSVTPDTTLIFGFTSNRLSHPALDTLKVATMVRGNFILDQNPTLHIASQGFGPTAFKVANEYIMQTSDSLYVYDCTSYTLKRKLRSEYGFKAFFYEAGVLTGLMFENRGPETWLRHGTYNAMSRQFVSENTNIIKLKAEFYLPQANSTYTLAFGLPSANDSITYPFIYLGQLVQKRGTRRYFYRRSNSPPLAHGANAYSRIFSITNNLDSVYFVDRLALPNGQAGGQHQIYRFDRRSAQYILVDSAYTDKTDIFSFHTRYGKAIIVANLTHPRIKQFPLSTPKEIELMPEQPIRVYPNPAGSSVNLRLGSGHVGGTYTILDPMGRTSLMGDYKPDQTIDIRTLAPGLYQVRVSAGSSTYSSRFVKH